MIKTTVTGDDSAFAALRKEIQEFMTDEVITVGVHEDEGAHDGAGITNAQLGAALNFGTPTIPARPWLEAGVESGHALYADAIENGIKNGQNLGDILNTVGVLAVSNVQQYMTQLRTPPNTPETIKRKGSSNPLIDTGELKSSVNYKINARLPTEGL